MLEVEVEAVGEVPGLRCIISVWSEWLGLPSILWSQSNYASTSSGAGCLPCSTAVQGHWWRRAQKHLKMLLLNLQGQDPCPPLPTSYFDRLTVTETLHKREGTKI